MKNHALYISAACLLSLTAPAFAQENSSWKDKIDLDTRLTLQYITEENTDLGTANQDMEDSFSQQLQVMMGVNFTEDLYGFVHGRGLHIDGETGSEDDSGASVSTDQDFLELRELYLHQKNIGAEPWSVQLGRQRIREPRALWWNSDNDAVRVHYNTTLLNGFVAASQNLSSYRSNTDSDFREDDEDRFRVLGEASYQYKYQHFIEGRFLYEDDHSGLESTGSLVNALNRDNEDQQLGWAGVRLTGQFDNPIPAAASIKYRADVMGVAGEEDMLITAAGPTPATRRVTGSTNRDVLGWGMDAGAIVDPGEKGGTAITVGYAFGSGDEGGTGTDHAFRQTDMQGSSSRIGLERQQQKNYGEVLRPELSNLHVVSAGAAYPVTEATDISATYFYYRLDEDAGGLRSSGISAPLNGTDKSLGQGLDLILNVRVDEEFQTKIPLTDSTNFRVVAGSFFPGNAYGPADDEAAFRLFTEIRFRFR